MLRLCRRAGAEHAGGGGMRLLFDQNLSPKLVGRVASLFPGSTHVQSVGLDSASDEQIWEYARLNGFAVVTKDEDYSILSVLRGHPPKVTWLQTGNCTTLQVDALFRARSADIEAFERDPSTGTLALV
jgi:predicted nuclease of predicted toxin-antitoxin system